jgi:hypothetical protein
VLKIEQIKRSGSGLPNFESHEAESCDLQLAIGQYIHLRNTTRLCGCVFSILEKYIGVLCAHISIFLGASSVKLKDCQNVDEIMPLSLIKEE